MVSKTPNYRRNIAANNFQGGYPYIKEKLGSILNLTRKTFPLTVHFNLTMPTVGKAIIMTNLELEIEFQDIEENSLTILMCMKTSSFRKDYKAMPISKIIKTVYEAYELYHSHKDVADKLVKLLLAWTSVISLNHLI